MIDELISNFTVRMSDSDLATLFSNCYPNTLDTTVYSFTPSTQTTNPSTFIITGDIPAQWFRDSSNQLFPYLPFVQQDPQLDELVCGLITRHTQDVLHDPFANAFNFNASGRYQSIVYLSVLWQCEIYSTNDTNNDFIFSLSLSL